MVKFLWSFLKALLNVRSIRALIMAQITLNIYTSDQIFKYVLSSHYVLQANHTIVIYFGSEALSSVQCTVSCAGISVSTGTVVRSGAYC